MERKEILISDMQHAFGTAQTSEARLQNKWQAVSYAADGVEGVMLYANRNMTVPDITLDPQLSGYYDIYIGMYIPMRLSFNDMHEALIKLSSDQHFVSVSPSTHIPDSPRIEHKIDEFRWRSADMTGETLTLRHPQNVPGYASDTAVAFFRFVPLTAAQFAQRCSEFADPRHKKIFATHDIHGFMFKYAPQTEEDWLMIPDEFLNSDVESLSIEYMGLMDGVIDREADTYPFVREGDKNVYWGLRRFILPEKNVYPAIIKRGHEIGLKMYMSIRMGAWGFEFPMNGYVFDNVFAKEHPQLCCMDRDGTAVQRMSYAYAEVRGYMLKNVETMLSYGCDGISLIYTRGTPYVLFEEPVRRLFAEEYPNVDCRTLRNTDPRLIKVRCAIMNDFMRAVRALIDASGRQRKLNVHVHTALKDNLYYGLDVETWVKEGLVDNIIVNNDYHWEDLSADVWADESETVIDLDKYEKWANSAPKSITRRNVYGHLIPREATDEYLALAAGTPVRVFCDLQRNSPEEAKEEALRLLDMGIRDFCIWDAYAYKPDSRLWQFCARLGHTENIRSFDISDYTKVHRLNVLAGMQVGRYYPWWGG